MNVGSIPGLIYVLFPNASQRIPDSIASASLCAPPSLNPFPS